MTQDITIRHGAGCEPELVRLAALDSQPPLLGPVLVAEAGGAARAAVSLDDDRAIADPFHASAPLVELLRLHAASLRPAPRPRRRLGLRIGRSARPEPAR
ncbi:MAG: hypothetical protein IRZ21_06415 [Thermoleophilaceae bacterium]|nr:hypothetical protein [Thermoleophilaceae bacterium]